MFHFDRRVCGKALSFLSDMTMTPFLARLEIKINTQLHDQISVFWEIFVSGNFFEEIYFLAGMFIILEVNFFGGNIIIWKNVLRVCPCFFLPLMM